MLIKKPPPHGSRGRTRCEATHAEAEQQHAPTSMRTPRLGRKKGRCAGCAGCCNISVLLLMVLEPISRAGAVGEPTGDTWHHSGKVFGFPTPPSTPPQPRQNPHGHCPGCRGTGTHGLRDRLHRGCSKALRAPKKVPAATQHHPARCDPRPSGPGVLEADRKISCACFGANPHLVGLGASSRGALPNGSPGTALKTWGGTAALHTPPK